MSDRLRIRDLRGEDRILEWEVDGEPVEYPIAGGTSVDLIAFMLELEQKMGSEDENEVLAAAAKAVDVIMASIHERTPDAPRLSLTIEEILGVLAFMAGGESVTAVVHEALTNEEPAQNGDTPGPAKSPEELEAADPLDGAEKRSPSAKSSRKQSSRSGSATSGSRSGSGRRRSAPSAPTSSSPASSTAS